MQFQDGNQEAAYSIDEIKELAKLYCEHLAKGLSKQSFVDCCYTTIEDRIKKQPDVFQSEKKEIEKSLRLSRKYKVYMLYANEVSYLILKYVVRRTTHIPNRYNQLNNLPHLITFIPSP